MLPRNKFFNAVFVTVLFLVLPARAGAQWATLEKGFSYRDSDQARVHFLRIDPSRFRVDLLLGTDYGTPTLTAHQYRERSGAMAVVNGGFFDELHHSLGLIQRRGKIENPVRENSWGVFEIEDGKLRILARKDWNPFPEATALQVGPRLVVNGQVQSFKESVPSRRSAVGITKDGQLVIAVSEKLLYLKEWAELLKRECPQALNLDGGGSTQLSVATPKIKIHIEGATAVPNAVAVFRK